MTPHPRALAILTRGQRHRGRPSRSRPGLALLTHLLLALALASPAVARAARLAAHALVVGSNRGGAGQSDLKYAHEDARRLREVLVGLGGFAPENVRLVLDPAREGLLAALAAERDRLTRLSQRGEPALFVFYYSGHARARALNLGREELPLHELRRRLTELPATVTVALLDACQTGALSRVKGAAPTADFSYNSVNDLNAAGLAVMTSSSASELSQETDTLRGSYFTHHLVVGLRGAADEDDDGKVTLSEAYRYTYHRTLVTTAATAVGRQHVTLETRLRGKGEMVLTRPARADAALRLAAPLTAQLLLHRADARQTVVAELQKAPGRSVRLALPQDRYTALVRHQGRTLRCAITLHAGQELALDLAGCTRAEPERVGVKGAARFWERLALEFGVGAMRGRSDGYSDQLESFGYDKHLLQLDEAITFQLALSYRLTRYLSLVLGWSQLERASWSRAVYDQAHEKREQTFEWSAHGLGLSLRATLPLWDGLFNPYLQGGLGLTWATTLYRDPLQASEIVDDELHFGYHLAVAGGIHVMPWRHLGGYGQLGYTFAPVIKNLLGETHDTGGPTLFFGLRGAL